MNRVFLIGNLTKDPELAETNSGIAVCHFSIAVNRSFSSQDGERQTDFFNVTAWRAQAENIAKYCRKGSKVAVAGSIQMRQYDDNQGNKRTAVDIIAQEVEFLTRGGNAEGGEYAPAPSQSHSPAPQRGAGASQPRKRPALEAFDDDGDMPF
ncbi:MAG: single-stranded DNA-binding protein [Christensenellaceae bacterium]